MRTYYVSNGRTQNGPMRISTALGTRADEKDGFLGRFVSPDHCVVLHGGALCVMRKEKAKKLGATP